MPLYDYQCPNCDNVKEVQHMIAELENPSEEILKEITCDCGTLMKRAFINVPGIKTPTRNRYLDVDRKKRNHNHFVKEVLPTLDTDSRNHHLKKLGKKL